MTKNSTDTRPFEKSDHGNAKRLLLKHGDEIRYHNSEMGESWYVWDGTRWHMDQKDMIFQKAKDTIDQMYDELRQVTDTMEAKQLLKFILISKNQRGLTAMIASAQNEPGVYMSMDEFDFNKDLINVKNGMVNLTVGSLLPPDKNMYITKMCNVTFNPDAQCPRWCQFLDEVCPDKEAQSYLQRFFGYSLTGHTKSEKILVLNGLGSNGKGVMIDTIKYIMGDYTRVTESTTILKLKHERTSSNDLADLYGYRFVVASETAANQILDEARIKLVTGGNTIKCRLLYKQYIEYIAQFKLILETNHRPYIESQDYSIWRRVDRVDFNQTFDESTRDENLRETLKSELDGIFQWMVQGAVEWYKIGLATPQIIVDATQNYKDELDDVGGFLEICTERDSSSKVSKTDLYKLFKFWCSYIDEVPISKKAFGKRLEENGYKHKKSNGIEYRTNIKIKSELFDILAESEDYNIRDGQNRVVRVLNTLLLESTQGRETGSDSFTTPPFTPCDSTDNDKNHPVFQNSEKSAQNTPISQVEIANILNVLRSEWDIVKKPKSTNGYFDMFVSTLIIRCKIKGCVLSKESSTKYVKDAFIAWKWPTY